MITDQRMINSFSMGFSSRLKLPSWAIYLVIGVLVLFIAALVSNLLPLIALALLLAFVWRQANNTDSPRN